MTFRIRQFKSFKTIFGKFEHQFDLEGQAHKSLNSARALDNQYTAQV